MTKPTLDDFLDNPYEAMRNGYYPDFMSCMALKADFFSFYRLSRYWDAFLEMFTSEAYMFPIYLFVWVVFLLIFISTPLAFPIWAIIYFFNSRKKFNRYHEKQKNKPKLMIDGVEQ